MPTLDYLTLPDTVGNAPAYIRKGNQEQENARHGEPDPITCIGVRVPVPVMVGGELMQDVRRVEILPSPEPVDTDAPDVDQNGRLLAARVLPNSRIVESGSPAITNVLLDAGYVPCDPPEAAQPRRPKKSPTTPKE